MTSRSKRQRAEPPDDHSDAEPERGPSAGAGAAERKRELERNRRNLVNTRFAELEAQLAKLPGAPKRVYRRIDKEVVLKDATQALSSQQRDLDLATARLQTMTTELSTLRSEKLELRHDKAYLHKELASARAENKTLAADNMLLWRALCKSGAVKSDMPSEVSKVPVELLFGPSTESVTDGPSSHPPAKGSVQEGSSSDSSGQRAVVDRAVVDNSLLLSGAPDVFQSLAASLESAGRQALPASPPTDDFFKLGDALGVPQLATTLLLSQSNRTDASEDSTSYPDIAPCG